MPRTLEQWKAETSKLPAEDRLALAEFLWESLEDLDVDDAAWEEELDRRVAEIRSGQAVGYPAHEVIAELRRELS